MEESALDTHDLDLLHVIDPSHQRGPSQPPASLKSGRRVSNNSDLSRSSHIPSSSLPKHEQNASASSSFPGPRHRLTSIMTRSAEAIQGAASPLAQIFQPLVFDDDQHDDQHLQDNNGVSYGPATRRRLSSMQWRNHPAADPSAPGAHSTALRRFPTQGSQDSRVKALSAQQPLSESPDSRTQPLETAEQIEEEDPQPPLERRLSDMEARQKRMEDLLIQISERMR